MFPVLCDLWPQPEPRLTQDGWHGDGSYIRAAFQLFKCWFLEGSLLLFYLFFILKDCAILLLLFALNDLPPSAICFDPLPAKSRERCSPHTMCWDNVWLQTTHGTYGRIKYEKILLHHTLVLLALKLLLQSVNVGGGLNFHPLCFITHEINPVSALRLVFVMSCRQMLLMVGWSASAVPQVSAQSFTF